MGKDNTHSVVLGVSNSTASMGITLAIPQDARNSASYESGISLLGTYPRRLHPTTEILARSCLFLLCSL